VPSPPNTAAHLGPDRRAGGRPFSIASCRARWWKATATRPAAAEMHLTTSSSPAAGAGRRLVMGAGRPAISPGHAGTGVGKEPAVVSQRLPDLAVTARRIRLGEGPSMPARPCIAPDHLLVEEADAARPDQRPARPNSCGPMAGSAAFARIWPGSSRGPVRAALGPAGGGQARVRSWPAARAIPRACASPPPCGRRSADEPADGRRTVRALLCPC